MVAAAARWMLAFAATASARHQEDTPVQKVITLLSDLKSQVETEGQAEAGTYDKFSCFCKETTDRKSSAITDGQDAIDENAATIQADSAEIQTKVAELGKRKAEHEGLTTQLQETTVRCASEKAVLDAKVADLTKAVSALVSAVQKLKDSKPSLLALRGSIAKSLAIADALSLVKAPQRKSIDAFIQQSIDPSDPTYKFQSQQIIETLEELETDFTSDKTETETELESLTTSCKQTTASLTSDAEATNSAIETLNGDIEALKVSVADGRTALLQAESQLKDDQEYLKELTQRCEKQARMWDQRSQQRAGELEALASALTILSGKVQSADTAVNARAFVQKRPSVAPMQATKAVTTFLQVHEHRQGLENRLDVSGVLRQEGIRLQSKALSALAEKIAANPFGQVKQLIQNLIERLLHESTQEGTKKGFCDTELGKATTERDFRHADVNKLNAEIGSLEAKQSVLELEIAELSSAIEDTNKALGEATEFRATKKTESQETIKQAKEGLEAVKEAIAILKVYYKNASKAHVFMQASPVDADAESEGVQGLSGAYKGNQEASTGIIGMLEVIQTDFERTVRTTVADEKSSAADFVQFDRTSKSDIAGKETKRTLDQQDLADTVNKIATGMSDMQTAQNLVDATLKTLADLKPMCIDSDMTFAERAAKREEEITALKTALCHLDPDNVESECQ